MVLHWETFVVPYCYLNRREMTSHLITSELEPFSFSVFTSVMSLCGFLSSPFICWHLEVFMPMCVNSSCYGTINTQPDTWPQIFFWDYFNFSYLFPFLQSFCTFMMLNLLLFGATCFYQCETWKFITPSREQINYFLLRFSFIWLLHLTL